MLSHLQGSFAKFVDSPYYSESEFCGDAVTVSFSKYLPWQAMHFLQRSTHFSKACCRPLITSKFLALELLFHEWKSPEIAWGEIRIEFCVRLGKSGSVEPHQNILNTVQISSHAISGLLHPWKRSSEVINFEVINGLQHVFEKWVERCKKCIAYRGRYFEKETVTAPLQLRLWVITWVHELFKRPSYIDLWDKIWHSDYECWVWEDVE
jgi:hypothetical protein